MEFCLQNLSNLFDPLLQQNWEGLVGEGTSLDLAAVHGMIQVESELGKGASFHIFLPTY